MMGPTHTSRRRLIVGMLLLALLQMLLAANALAGVDCEKNPEHRRCPDDPQPTTTVSDTTTTTVIDPAPTCGTVNSITGSGFLRFECDWTPLETATTGTVHVTVTKGAVSYLWFGVLDSWPGDYCGEPGEWDQPTETEFTVNFPLVSDEGTYWLQKPDWCGTYRIDDNGDPLTVKLSARMKKDTELRLTLTPEQSS